MMSELGGSSGCLLYQGISTTINPDTGQKDILEKSLVCPCSSI